MDTKAVTIHVPNEFHTILNEIQQKIKQEANKKVALSEILLDFAKKGMQKEQEIHSTQEIIDNNTNKNEIVSNNTKKMQSAQNESINTQEKRHSTQNESINAQNFEHFTHDLIAKRTNSDLNFTNRKETKKRLEELKLREDSLKEREAELKQDEDDLFDKRWELVNSQEQVNSKLYETREKDLIISQKDAQIEFLKTEIIRITTQYQNEIERLDNRKSNEIIDLKSQKENLTDKLENFEDKLKGLEYSNKTLLETLQSFISKSQEKTVFDYIEPFLPTIATICVLIFNNNKDENKIETLKTELFSMFNKQKAKEEQKSE